MCLILTNGGSSMLICNIQPVSFLLCVWLQRYNSMLFDNALKKLYNATKAKLLTNSSKVY